LAWTIEYTATALKQLHKLDRQVAKRVLDFMDDRIAPSGEPRSNGKALTGSTYGALWRYRVGDCRVICDIQDERLLVLVIEVGHRKEIYR
jgi:mRNA interferase RelE/StbE